MAKKVFELAKELGIRPLDLVEILRPKIPTVRNHMSSLTDEEVDKVIEDLGKTQKQDSAEGQKKTKKKTAKKSQGSSKKKIVTVQGKDRTEDSERPRKKTTVRKKVVVRKQSPAKRESAPPLKKEIDDKTKSPQAFQEEEKKERQETKENNRDFEDVASGHRFTPVYVPGSDDRDKEKKDAVASERPQEGSDKGEGQKETPEKESKRRLGGLATMMSGKKVNRSRVLEEGRTEDELKSYTALSGKGRPIYTTVKKRKQYTGPVKGTQITTAKESKRVVKIYQGTTAVELAKKLKVKFKDLVNDCLDLNLLVSQEDFLGPGLASKISALYGHRVEDISFQEENILGPKKEISEEDVDKLPLRNPVITIMGHVDHGKTTLLDRIRNANVADQEAGGITQHIGAYTVETQDGKGLTFLDTPGHLAFSAMRERGAKLTDIVILVVAADDGIMPQTQESIRHIQNAKVPLIVAINKIDKENASPDKVKQELSEFNIISEDWGGDTQMVPVSALKKEGIEELLEAAALQAEMMQLRADSKGKASGVVLESKVEIGRGPVATLLVQEGTLKKGNNIVVGESYGRARSLRDDKGIEVKAAGPSIPVQVLGLSQAPRPGDLLAVVKNEGEAKKIVANRIGERKKLENTPVQKQVSLEDFFSEGQEEGKKELQVIIRTDVLGSFEAVKHSLEAMGNREVGVKVVGGGVGPINDNDVMLAEFSKGIILGLNMRPVTGARQLAERKGIDIKTYLVIYELLDDMEMALEGMLGPTITERYIGRAEVKETFVIPKIGAIGGSIVIDGSMKVGCRIRLLRESKIIFDGELSSLRRFKDDVKEVKNGLECGIGLKDYNDIKVGDIFEAYISEKKKRTLEDVEKESQAKRESESVGSSSTAEVESRL